MNKPLRTIVAATFLLGGTFVMVTLGTWQVQRMAWKQNIIKELDALYQTASPQQYTHQDLIQASLNNQTLMYGQVTGKPLTGKQMLFGPKPQEGKIGYHVVTPIAINGDMGKIILVQRGFIENEETQSLTGIEAPSDVSFTGIIRKPDWNKYTPNNSPENGIWSKLDIDEIATYQALENVAPYILYTAQTYPRFDKVIPLDDKWYPRNKHKQYALFWFSMAGIFLCFFGFVAFQARRKKRARP